MLFRLFSILGILCIIGLSTGCSKTTDPECEVLDTAFHGEWDFYKRIEYNPDGTVLEEVNSTPNGLWDIFIDETHFCDIGSCEEYCVINGSYNFTDFIISVEFIENDLKVIIYSMDDTLLRELFLIKL